MPDPAPRIFFAAPDESLIQAFYQAIPKDEHNILAMSVLDQSAASVVEYARTCSIEVIISRGGIAELLRKTQKRGPSTIPIVQIQVTPFDIIDAMREAQKISRNMTFIAYANMLEGAKKIMDLLDLELRFVALLTQRLSGSHFHGPGTQGGSDRGGRTGSESMPGKQHSRRLAQCQPGKPAPGLRWGPADY